MTSVWCSCVVLKPPAVWGEESRMPNGQVAHITTTEHQSFPPHEILQCHAISFFILSLPEKLHSNHLYPLLSYVQTSGAEPHCRPSVNHWLQFVIQKRHACLAKLNQFDFVSLLSTGKRNHVLSFPSVLCYGDVTSQSQSNLNKCFQNSATIEHFDSLCIWSITFINICK